MRAYAIRLFFVVLFLPSTLFAQKKPDVQTDDELIFDANKEGKENDEASKNTAESETGDQTEAEIPDNDYDDPNLATDASTVEKRESAVAGTAKNIFSKSSFPTELAQRPLVVPEHMLQLSYDLPVVVSDNGGAWGTLVGRFGLIEKLEVSARYGTGALFFDKDNSPGGNTFEPGKAGAVGVRYLIAPRWASLEATVPFFFGDEFGFGITLAAPIRIEITPKWVILAGEDLVQIAITGFHPVVKDPSYNLGTVSIIQNGNDEHPGNLNFQFKLIHQLRANTALYGQLGAFLRKFDSKDPPFPFFVGYMHTNGNLDLSARVGFGALDELGDTFTAGLYAAYRL